MKRTDSRVPSSRWRTLGKAALALAAVTVIGATSITPAKADWRDRDWHHHHHGGVGFGFSVGSPGYYGYYPYPAYYPAYPAYSYGYPYYYDSGPSFSIGVGVH